MTWPLRCYYTLSQINVLPRRAKDNTKAVTARRDQQGRVVSVIEGIKATARI